MTVKIDIRDFLSGRISFQETLDFLIHIILKQGVKSVNLYSQSTNSRLYKSAVDICSPVGHMIPMDIYFPSMEQYSVFELIEKYGPLFNVFGGLANCSIDQYNRIFFLSDVEWMLHDVVKGDIITYADIADGIMTLEADYNLNFERHSLAPLK